MTNILPHNATPQERTITEAIDYPLNPHLIRGFKFDPANSIIPWLILEYGLGEIAKWVADPKVLLKDGIKFQRLKGTPAALELALSWIYDGQIIVEEETPGPHFAEFQVGLHDVPPNFFVDALVALSECAAPARSKLMRLYNDRYDIRRLVLNGSSFGNILSDYSGVRLKVGGPVLSFGRVQPSVTSIAEPHIALFADHTVVAYVVSEDIYRLDAAVLSETPIHVINHNGINARDHFEQNQDDFVPQLPDLKPYAFSKAQIVLSDSWALEDINACFGVTAIQLVGDTFGLNHDRLSDNVWRTQPIPYLERLAQCHLDSACYQTQPQVLSCIVRKNMWICLVDMCDPKSSVKSTNTYIHTNYPGPITWHQHRHLARPWRDQQFRISVKGK